MADNLILPFAFNDTGTNLLTQEAYEQDNDRFLGNQPGVARSTLVNKTLRQTSAIAAGVAEFMARHAEAGAADVTDGMTPAEVADYLANVIGSFAATGLPGGGEAGQALVIGENGPEWRFVSGDPIGTIIAFAGKAAPKGFLSINYDVETVVPVAAYPQLVETVYCGDEANEEADFFYRAMNADGSVRHPEGGYLVLPAASKYFLRGRDAGGVVESYRYQGDAIRNICGEFFSGNDKATRAVGGMIEPTGAFYRNGEATNFDTQGGNKGWHIAFDASLVVPTAVENRPINFPVLWCIKAWDAPVNQGDLDVQALVNTWREIFSLKLNIEDYKALGNGQTWQDVTKDRTVNTNYTNSTGRSIMVVIGRTTSGTGNGSSTPYVDDVPVGQITTTNTTYAICPASFIVPSGSVYSFEISGSARLLNWSELR